MSGISEQYRGGLTIDTGFRVDGPEQEVEGADLPEPTEADTTLGPRWGSERWNVPGFGESGPRCGEVSPVGVCEHGHVDWGEHRCGRRTCPKCWAIWAREAAVRATTRIQAFRETQPNDRNRQVVHAVVSPETEQVKNRREYWDWYSKASEIAEEKGMRGYAVIGHPFRVTDAGKYLYRQAGGDDSEFGMWVWLRNELEEAVLREVIEFSPHYHLIGLAGEDMDPAQDSDGAAYTFIRSLTPYYNPHDRESHEDLYGLFRYLLSHTGYPEGSTKQVTRWYGDLANNVFVDDATEEWQIQKPVRAAETIQREVEAIAGVEPESDGESSNERDTCDYEGCEAEVIEVEGLRQYLAENDPPDDVKYRMRAVKEWRHSGLVGVQPGLKHPATVEEGEEVIEALVESWKVFQS